ncbi:MAG: ribonuclease HII [Chlamydiales bacterium 38-26]|nr:ribonuclease HII [Chlamydiales bacterium]OJV09464.1 MAG: ribonuclease HII [Chlamydiales bacterium 38-26]
MGKRETKRLLKLNSYEDEARSQGYQLIAGVDEAGRGPLAGPVVAAACIIPQGILIPGVNDSKQLNAGERAELFQLIISDDRIVYGVGIVDPQTIDKVNIYQATILAMLEAISKLPISPHFLLVDGMKLPHPSIPAQKIIDGDAKSQSIAAASIIAKETRDQLMVQYHERWPEYGFNQHKGYGTEKHLKALQAYGICPLHRLSFEPVKALLKIEDPQLQFSL